MIKILPTGTSAVLKYGLKPTRSSKFRGRLGDGSKECTFELGSAELQAIWKDNRVEAVLKTTEDCYVRSISLEFRFKSPRPSNELTVWTESYADIFATGRSSSIPGTFTGDTARKGAWAFGISESRNAEGLFFSQSPPVEYPVLFNCRPMTKSLTISWILNRSFDAGESLILPKIGIRRGSFSRVIQSWYREWKNSSSRELPRDRRTSWCGGSEIVAPKDLREVLGVIRTGKMGLNCFYIGPEYASMTGDWLLPSDPFKDRMGGLSRTITEQNIVPGIRIAPFLVAKKSVLASEHRDWLVKNSNDSPITVPGYAGERETLFVLDITSPEVIAHLRRTLSVMRDQWGFRAYFLERIGDVAIAGTRCDNRVGPGTLLKSAAEAVRETLGNKVMLVASGLPLLTTPGIWDSQVMTPPFDQNAGFSSRRKHRKAMSIASAILHRSPWNEIAWINGSGLLPVKLFTGECGDAAETLITSIQLSSGLISLTGDPRTLDEGNLKIINEFLVLFEECRKGSVVVAPNIGGGRIEPLVVRNNRGWIALFNFSERKRGIQLDRDNMKSSLGVSTPLSAGDGAVFNSPEIHVALPPRGHRLFRG